VYCLICRTFPAQPSKVDGSIVGARGPLTKLPTLVARSTT